MTDNQKMSFEWTMSFGQLAQVITIALVGAGVFYGLENRVSRLEDHNKILMPMMAKMEASIAEISKQNQTSIEKFQLQVNSRMDSFGGALTSLSVSVGKTETNVDNILRNMRK